jgi:hypothetical protein
MDNSLKHTFVVLFCALVAIGIGLRQTYPPEAVSADAPPDMFSAHRALMDVKRIGLKPHPTGTSKNTQIRRYLTESIAALGYTPENQSTLVVNPNKQSMARIHNILVRVPGIKPGKAVLLSAHYDSVATGPGGADDAASVAAMLEVLRTLKHTPRLSNDVVFLFTDGEEMGLFGAHAFINQHPWAKDIGLALNFEYRGNRGAFMMFETSSGNGKLIEGLADSKAAVWTNSLMYEVYKRLPNDTDFTVIKNSGIPGVNFAAIEGHTAYHTALDRPEFLDKDSLQQEGNIMLALIRQFGNTSLVNLKSDDRIYFDLAGFGLIHYSSSWVSPLNGVLVALFVIAVGLRFKNKQVSALPLLLSPWVFLSVTASLAFGSHLLWQAINLLHPGYDSFAQGDTYNSHWYLAAFLLLNISLFGILHSLTSRWFNPDESFTGAAACWLLLAVTSGIIFPGASFLLTWPLAAMLSASILASMQAEKPGAKTLTIYLFFIGSLPGLLLFTPLIKGLFIGLTPRMIAVVVVFLCLLSGLLTPVVTGLFHRKKILNGLLLSTLICFAAGSATSGFDAEHPRQNTLFYALDSNTQSAYWLSTDKQLDHWTKTFFGNQKEQRYVPGIFGGAPLKLWSADAPILSLSPPEIETLDDSTSDGKRTLTIKIKSARHTPKLNMTIEGIEILASKVAGLAYTSAPQTNWRLKAYGLNDEDLVIEITVKPDKPFTLRISDVSYGLPDIKQTVRPSDSIAKPGEYSDTVVVVKHVRF